MTTTCPLALLLKDQIAKYRGDRVIIPEGSEGSLKYNVLFDPERKDATIMIWGDLRAFDDNDKIVNYFTRIVKDHHVRSGILEIKCNEKIFLYRYDNGKGWVL